MTYPGNHNYGTEKVQAKPKVLHAHVDVSYLYTGEESAVKNNSLHILNELKFKLHVSAHLYSSRHPTVRHRRVFIRVLHFDQFWYDLL